MRWILIFLVVELSLAADNSVHMVLSTNPAVFGQNIVLSCEVGQQLRNCKACQVRHWSGGSNQRDIMSDSVPAAALEAKYEDKTNLSSRLFSLVIKDLSLSDVDVDYTCFCGFDSVTMKLKLNSTMFIAPPTNVSFEKEQANMSVTTKVLLTRVFPEPVCSQYIGESPVSNMIPVSKHNGLFFDMTYEATFNVTTDECGEQLHIICKYSNDVNDRNIIKIRRNVTTTCPDRSVNKGKKAMVSSNMGNTNQHDSSTVSQTTTPNDLTIIVVIVASLCGCIIVVVSVCFWKKRKKNQDDQNNATSQQRFLPPRNSKGVLV